MGPLLDKINQNILVIALVIVGIVGIILLAIPVVIPLLGMLVALGIIAAAIYGIYVFLTKKP